MPGSNQYSQDPDFVTDVTGSTSNTAETVAGVTPGTTGTTPVSTSTPPVSDKPSPFYQQRNFKTEKLNALKGLMSDRRAQRKVNRYLNSDEGKRAEEAFMRAESKAYMDSVDDYIRRSREEINAKARTMSLESQLNAATAAKPAQPVQPVLSAAEQRSRDYWLAQARPYGFNTLEEVEAWQRENNLFVDGKFGKNSRAMWNRLHNSGGGQQRTYQGQRQGGAQNQAVEQSAGAIPNWRKAAIQAGVILKPGATPEEDTAAIRAWQKQHNIAETGVFDEASVNAFRAVIAARSQQGNSGQTGTVDGGTVPVAVVTAQRQQPRTTGTWAPRYWRSHHNGIKGVRIDGVEYPVMVSTGLAGYEGGLGIENDHSYALDPNTGKVRKLTEYATGNINGTWADGSTWVDQSKLNTLARLTSSAGYQRVGILRKQQMRRDAGLSFKQGGTMNKINYFQQGGAYPRYDLTEHPNFRMPHYKHPGQVTMDGKTYPMRVTTGMWNPWGIPLNNDESYAIDPETGKVRQLDENIFGRTTGKWAKDSEWKHVPILHRDLWRKHNPKATFDTEDDLYGEAILGLDLGYLRPEDLDSLDNRAKTKKHQQGGTMAAQQDIKAQVTALVQAAMQGDKKANQQVNQIMEAAKAGNQQAMQLAQMIAEVAKQLQGQATAAKWGAKLNYIQSLKFAKGGKTCPACKKKVETKACGGKKAKKHQEGGWLELLPIYGTYQAGKRFYKNPSWRTAGEFGLNFLGDAAMLSGIGLGAKAAVTGLRAAALAGKVGKVGKTTMEGLKTARQFAKTQKTMGRMSEAAARNFVKTGAPVASPLPANFRVPEQVFRNVVDAGLKQDRIADTFIDATRAAKAATGAGAAGMVAKVGALE